MDVLTQLSIIMFIVLVLFVAFLVYKTKKRPSTANYMAVAVFSLFIVASVLGILGHPGWCALIIIMGALFCAILVPFALADNKVEIADAVKKVDASDTIRVKDFFTGWSLILKLKRKYGPNKAMVIYLTSTAGILIVTYSLTIYLIENLILINDRWYRGTNWPTMLIGLLIGYVFISYINAKWAMKSAENNSTSSQTYGYTLSSRGTKANFCTNCGTPIIPEAVFCTNCGKHI